MTGCKKFGSGTPISKYPIVDCLTCVGQLGFQNKVDVGLVMRAQTGLGFPCYSWVYSTAPKRTTSHCDIELHIPNRGILWVRVDPFILNTMRSLTVTSSSRSYRMTSVESGTVYPRFECRFQKLSSPNICRTEMTLIWEVTLGYTRHTTTPVTSSNTGNNWTRLFRSSTQCLVKKMLRPPKRDHWKLSEPLSWIYNRLIGNGWRYSKYWIFGMKLEVHLDW